MTANPSDSDKSGEREFWLRATRRLSFRRNLAAWADVFLSLGLAVTGVTALVLLAVRLMGRDPRVVWYGWAGMLGICALVGAGMVMRRPFTRAEALVRLDEVEKLHNRLTAAFHGVGPWPGKRPGARDTVRWNWPRLGVPMIVCAMLLGAVSLVELPRLTMSTRPSEEPIAWAKIESWLNTLEKAKLVEPAALNQLEQQLDELRHQAEKNWYSQNSLEAGDTLQQQTAQALRELEENLQKSAEILDSAEQAGQMQASELQSLSAALKEAAGHMLSGNLPLNKELGDKLRNFDPSTLKSMSPEQLQALRQRLTDGSKICSECLGPNGADPDGLAKQGKPTGHGGGGGPAPLGLDENAENLHTQRVEGASNDDPSRALPGEVMAIAKGKHNTDKNAKGEPVEGGAISSVGQGGDAVWRDSLTPAEREILQKYFK